VGQIITPFAFGWDSKSAGIGIDRLAKNGMIVPVSERVFPAYYLSRELEIFCAMTIGLLGFATVQIDEVKEGGRKGVFYVNILRTPATIWVTGFNNLKSSSPDVIIFSTDGFFLSHAMAELFERSGRREPAKLVPEKGQANKENKSSTVTCPSCKAQVAQEMKFCGYCGKPMPSGEKKTQPPKKQFCTSCGNEIKVGMRFCTNCGALIKEKQQIQPTTEHHSTVAQTCTACGANIAFGKKFCTKCGAPLIEKKRR
jgi:predicted nucleic acid-binding Zn ribbon protein